MVLRLFVLVLLFFISDSSASDTSTTASASADASKSRVFMQGRLSIGCSYSYELTSSPRYVGSETKDGWMVKVPNVALVTPDGTADATTFEQAFGIIKSDGGSEGGNDGEVRYYLLSKSEGYNFYNKLVKAREIEDEM
jgi:hypothetical protein